MSTLLKRKIHLDDKFHVPDCYVKFFFKTMPSSTQNTPIINIDTSKTIFYLTSLNNKRKKNHKMIEITWGDKFPSQCGKKEELKKKLTRNLKAVCASHDKSLVLSGPQILNVKKYLKKEFKLTDKQIELQASTSLVPSKFEIKLSYKLGSNEIVFKCNPKAWDESSYKDFFQQYAEFLTNQNLQFDENVKDEYKKRVMFSINCNDDNDIHKVEDFFKNTFKMSNNKIKTKIHKRDKEPESFVPKIRNKDLAFSLKNLEKSKKNDPFFNELANTIIDFRNYNKLKIEKIEFRKNLVFRRSGKIWVKYNEAQQRVTNKIGELFYFWVTSFKIYRKQSEDKEETGKVNEGDKIIVTLDTKKITGDVVSINRGILKARFRLKKGLVPPGHECKAGEKEAGDETEEENKKEKFLEEEDINEKISKIKTKEQQPIQKPKSSQDSSSSDSDSDDDENYDDNEDNDDDNDDEINDDNDDNDDETNNNEEEEDYIKSKGNNEITMNPRKNVRVDKPNRNNKLVFQKNCSNGKQSKKETNATPRNNSNSLLIKKHEAPYVKQPNKIFTTQKEVFESITSQKEEVIDPKEEDIDRREEEKEAICQKEEAIGQEEEAIDQKEEAIDQKEETIDQKEEDIDQKEEDIDQKEEDIDQKEEDIDQKEEDIDQKEEDIGQEKEAIDKKEEEKEVFDQEGEEAIDKKEEEKEVFDQEEEDDDDEVEEEENEDEFDDNNDGPYIIKFVMNEIWYKRCALGLLSLNSSDSPIRRIILNNDPDNKEIEKCNDTNEEIKVKDWAFNLSNQEGVTDQDRQNPEFMKYIRMDLIPAQIESIKMILTKRVSIVHGPPGCGKTTAIGLFAYYLMQNSNEPKKILLSAYSNQAVENIAKFITPIMKALGKKMVWIAKSGLNFNTKDEFEHASLEQQNMTFYQIMKRKTEEAHIFQTLQYKKWRVEQMKKEQIQKKRKNANNQNIFEESKDDQINERFSMSDQLKMEEIQSQIEQNLIDDADVVCCTLISSGKGNILNYDFDYVIIDEASQANQIVSLIPFIHEPSKIVLLGDHNQLDAQVPSNELQLKHPDTSRSLYLKLLNSKVPSVMLNRQFRMNPFIAEFPNRVFYENQIQCHEDLEQKTQVELEALMTPIMFVNTKNGREKKVYNTTYENEEEANVIEIILNNLQQNKVPGKQVGVITPYRGQYELIREKCNNLKYRGVKCSCVDSFQGTERDYIILSLVRTNRQGRFGFITDIHRINVSLTRARKGLFIVGNYDSIVTSGNNDLEKNKILIKMCQFYKELGALVDSEKITRIEKAKTIRINFKGEHPLPLKKLIDQDFWKDYKDLKNDVNDTSQIEKEFDYDYDDEDDYGILI